MMRIAGGSHRQTANLCVFKSVTVVTAERGCRIENFDRIDRERLQSGEPNSGAEQIIGVRRNGQTAALVNDVAYFTCGFSFQIWQLGADAKGATTNGENALFGAGYRGWNTLLELLIEKGADVNAVSKAGVTPWLAASGYGDRLGGVLYNKEGADLLLKHGADPKLGKPCQAQIKCR